MSAYPPMRTTTDTYTGKPFRWNDTVLITDHPRYGTILTPSRLTSRTWTWLHPDRVPLGLLRKLNPDNVTLASNAHPVLGAVADNDPMSCVHGVSMSVHCRECEAEA